MLLIHGTVCTLGCQEVRVIEDGAVYVEGDTIREVGETEKLMLAHPQEREVHDARGALVLPGFVCAHGHFYGLFSRGMSLYDEPPSNFLETLERLWWRLDRALDDESNRLGAQSACCAALRCGTTCIIDHHSSPGAVTGSLDHLATAAVECGVRCCLCYEVTDRNGLQNARDGIAENVRFLRRCRAPATRHPLLAGAFGLHASFTVSDDTLAKSVAAVLSLETDGQGPVGYHVHVAESPVDETLCQREHGGMRVVQRLAQAGVLGPSTVLGHGVHMDAEEMQTAANSGCSVVTNMRSNMNNAVGLPDVALMKKSGIKNLGLGTDGMAYDMIEEYKSAALAMKHRAGDPRVGTLEAFDMLFRANSEIASKFFGRGVGRLEPGCVADLVVLDYHSPTQINSGNLPWHLAFGVNPGRDVTTVFVGGRKVVEAGRVLTVDERSVASECRRVHSSVWSRMRDVVQKSKSAK